MPRIVVEQLRRKFPRCFGFGRVRDDAKTNTRSFGCVGALYGVVYKTSELLWGCNNGLACQLLDLQQDPID